MVIYYLTLIMLTKTIYQFSIDSQFLPVQIRDTRYQKMLINNHTDANKGKIKGFLHLEDVFAKLSKR